MPSVTSLSAIDAVLRCYPKIYFACHLRHVQDERTNRIISSQHASILDHLDAVEPTTVHQLAQHMGVTPSTMSHHVDRLQAAGYALRVRDPRDSRRVHVRLTKAGVRIKQQQKVLDPELIRALLAQLPPADVTRAIAGLELLAGAAKRLVDSGSLQRAMK